MFLLETMWKLEKVVWFIPMLRFMTILDFIIQLKGREVEENGLILIENNEVVGYGYTNLAFQESKISILRSILTPIEHKELAKTIIKNYLKTNTTLKIKRF